MAQKRIQKTATETKTEEAPQEEAQKADTKEELKDELDELLEEIDGLLEENAEAFVRNYIQKGANESFPPGGQRDTLEAWKKYAPPALNFSTSTSFMPTGLSRMV